MKDDICLRQYSISSWDCGEIWDEYFFAVEKLLNDRLVKLDDSDPIKRKAHAGKGEGDFVARFNKNEDSRWVQGIFQKTKIEIEIQHYRNGRDSFGRVRENKLSIYIPENIYSRREFGFVVDLFRLGNEMLSTFYAYGDIDHNLIKKTPSTPSLDISCELLGVFWLTYFGKCYCEFFTMPKLLGLEEMKLGPGDGVTLQLADSPIQVKLERRNEIEIELGELSFVGFGQFKARGKYAISMESMLNVSKS